MCLIVLGCDFWSFSLSLVPIRLNVGVFIRFLLVGKFGLAGCFVGCFTLGVLCGVAANFGLRGAAYGSLVLCGFGMRWDGLCCVGLFMVIALCTGWGLGL